jgi:hypothetical protein
MATYPGNEKWRKAYPDISVSDDGLSPFKGRFPSLEVNDFLNYLESRGTDKDVHAFVKLMAQELIWAYCNWTKALRDADSGKLLGDMMNGAFENEAVKRYITDYAKANNLLAVLPSDDKPPPWLVDENTGEVHVIKGQEQVVQ